MAALREIKDRIGSVRSTLKITSAMKLVASAKLRKSQRAIEGMRPYERTLNEILSSVSSLCDVSAVCSNLNVKVSEEDRQDPAVAVVAVSSNSSLCGGFNSNVIRKTLEAIKSETGKVEVYPIGRKMADAMKKAGFTSSADYNDLIGHPGYEKSAQLAHMLVDRYNAGEISKVLLVYNRFVSTSTQVPVVEIYLPFGNPEIEASVDEEEYIIEPDAESLAKELLPKLLVLKFHAAILDSAAAEQAARTIAMQTATDNAENLLGELTLEYNKGRQQKITSEILDLLGGATE